MISIDSQAKIQMRLFYGGLESLLKRHTPIDYASTVAVRLRHLRTKTEDGAYTPPHFLLHSIEANCAWHRGQNQDPVSSARLYKIMGYYIQNLDTDPYTKVLFKEKADIVHVLRMIHRQQIEIQEGLEMTDLLRCISIFLKNGSMVQTVEAFSEKYMLTIADWFKLSILVYTITLNDPRSRLSKEQLSQWITSLPESVVDAYLNLASRTPNEISAQYRQERNDIPHLYHWHIRCSFLHHPLIHFGEGRYLAPLPHLVIRHATQSLYNLAKEASNNFFDELGNTFEDYVGKNLFYCPNVITVLTEKEIRKIYTGKNCDFILDFEDAIMLVECKAAIFTRRLITKDALAVDNSTRKIQDAIKQLNATEVAITSGVFKEWGISNNKPIIKVVTTFGDIPFVNSDWYFSQILGIKETSDIQNIAPHSSLRKPMILSVSVLEMFLIALRVYQKTPLQLISEKEKENYYERGDWGAYLSSILRNTNHGPLPHLKDILNEVFEEIKKTFHT